MVNYDAIKSVLLRAIPLNLRIARTGFNYVMRIGWPFTATPRGLEKHITTVPERIVY